MPNLRKLETTSSLVVVLSLAGKLNTLSADVADGAVKTATGVGLILSAFPATSAVGLAILLLLRNLTWSPPSYRIVKRVKLRVSRNPKTRIQVSESPANSLDPLKAR